MVKVNEKNQGNKGKISAIQLIDRINKRTDLNRMGKFEKVIDIAYKRIYGVKENNWEKEFDKADTLTKIVENQTIRGKNLRIKEAVNNWFQISKL